MKKNLFVLCTLAVVNFNFSQEKQTQSLDNKIFEVIRNKDPKSKLNADDLKNLSFAYSYNAVMTKLDTIEDHKIRERTDYLTLATVKYVLPNIEILNDTIIQGIDFRTMIYYYNNIGIYGFHKGASKRTKKKIAKLSSPLSNKNQMIFLNAFYEQTKTSVFSFYILDPNKLEVLYFDRIHTKYDVRNESSVVKSINYLIDTLKETLNR